MIGGSREERDFVSVRLGMRFGMYTQNTINAPDKE